MLLSALSRGGLLKGFALSEVNRRRGDNNWPHLESALQNIGHQVLALFVLIIVLVPQMSLVA